jgi:hypothetical protein
MSVWYILEGIAKKSPCMNWRRNIESLMTVGGGVIWCIHPVEGVKFYKDENGLPFFNLEESMEDTTAMLVQIASEEAAVMLFEMVCQNYKGYTKKEVLCVNEALSTKGMIRNPSKADFKGLV